MKLQELNKLSYNDVPYAPLNALLDKAATKWQQAEYYSRIAGRKQGNERMNCLAKSARYYFRAQAFALQVYNSLVPPAKRPEDLGLREWFGAWGDWATRGDN